MNNETEKNFRIELYEVIGEGGRYFAITVRAFSRQGAIETMRNTYESTRYKLASISVES